jgi:hypothetical protein
VARAPSGCAPCFVEGGDRINAACAAALRAGPSAGGCVLVNADGTSLNKHCGELTGMSEGRDGISDLEEAFPGFEAAYGAATGVALSSLGRPGVDILEREVPRLLPRPSRSSVWKSTTGSGGPHQTSELSISVTSKSIRLIFGRIDRSRRVLEARQESTVRSVR